MECCSRTEIGLLQWAGVSKCICQYARPNLCNACSSPHCCNYAEKDLSRGSECFCRNRSDVPANFNYLTYLTATRLRSNSFFRPKFLLYWSSLAFPSQFQLQSCCLLTCFAFSLCCSAKFTSLDAIGSCQCLACLISVVASKSAHSAHWCSQTLRKSC